MADAGHKEGNVALDIYWEILHLGDKLGSGGCMDGAVDFKVQEVGTHEGMVPVFSLSNWLYMCTYPVVYYNYGLKDINSDLI